MLLAFYTYGIAHFIYSTEKSNAHARLRARASPVVRCSVVFECGCVKMDRSDDPYDFDDDFEEAVRQYRRTSTPPASGSRQPQDLQPANAETTRAVQSNPDETGYTLTAGV